MPNTFLVLRSRVPLPESVGDLLRERGTLGVWEVSAREWRAYFAGVDPETAEALLALEPDLSLRWEEEEPMDWAARYQASLRPIAVGSRFVILPSPELENPWPGRVPLKLVPGMAFGTGEHYTTASCLRSLEDLPSVPRRVFDLGCGTGILAAAAVKIGASEVVACDIDPDACEVSRQTAEVNGTPFEVLEGGADVTAERFDCVLANILAQTLVELMPEIRRRLSDEGHLIGSGILLSLGDDVLKAASDNGLRLLKRRTDGEWWTFLWRVR
jgi:ribosomal protein L11 methyltransferase